jgi:ribosomal protein S18 acetylase RimI-like enzyme
LVLDISNLELQPEFPTSCVLAMPPNFQLLPMAVADYNEVLDLWNSCEGVRANETPDEFARILARNPGLCSVIRRDTELAAAVLACHDGRRGYLYHLGVAAQFRRHGLGRLLVEHSLARLKAEGISRCTIFVIRGNEAGETFWKRAGWRERTDLGLMAIDLSSNATPESK